MTKYQFLRQSLFERVCTLRYSLPGDDVFDELSPVQRGYYDAVRDEINYLESVILKLPDYGKN